MIKRAGIRFMAPALLLQGLFLLFAQEVRCQETGIRVNTDWDHERHSWIASWITHPEALRTGYGVFHFRNTLQLDEVPDSLLIYISADNRYRLTVNGKDVARGPARGSLMYWRYESLDLAPYLSKGRNVIAAEVYNLGPFRPAAQYSYQSAFIFQADDPRHGDLNTPGSWKVIQNKAYEPIEVSKEMVKGYYVAGPTDRIDGGVYPWEWDQSAYNDEHWLLPSVITKGVGRGYMHGVPWMLVPRNIPMMEERPEYLKSVRRAEGVRVPGGFPSGKASLRIPPGRQVKVLLDQEYLTTTYPLIEVSEGKGATLTLTYAESLYQRDMKKGNRDEVEGKLMLGYRDRILPDGGSHRLYRTLGTRTYRYVELEVNTEDEALIIHGIHGIFTAYPFEKTGGVETGRDFLDGVQEIGWRTARLCAAETYMDCPYYEQLQYLGDTRIQALISLYVSGDDRLMRNTLLQADHSRLPEGLTLSRAPSAIPQIIPAFSLFWVDMVHDYHMHRSDDAFISSFLPGIRSVLGWFERRLREDGLLGGLEWLNFADWTDGYMVGSPPGVDLGGSALVSLKFAYALERASELHAYFGEAYYAEKYRSMAARLRQAVYTACWDEERQLLAGTPGGEVFSQHTNIFGILTGAVPKEKQRELMQRILDDSSLVQTTIYFRFYLFEALFKTGMADLYTGLLGTWKEMMDKGLTTWEEGDYEERSDCHAWGSSPNYHLLSLVCGIRPGAPGFSRVRISPYPGELRKFSGVMPHPEGPVLVSYDLSGEGQGEAVIELPPGTEGDFYWKGDHYQLLPGIQHIPLK